MKTGLTKNDSFAVKGMAILLMLFHHLYCETQRFDGYDISFAPFSQDFVVSISLLCKVCVSIFAFITGYGLVKSISKIELNRKNVAKWSVTRLIKTMSGFWFIYVISFIATFIINSLPATKYFTEDNLNGILYIILDFLGLAKFFETPTLNGTWWYMSAAIVFIIIVPVIYTLSKKIGYLPVIVCIAALPRLMNVGYPGGVNIYTFILSVAFGMMFADYRLFEKITEASPKNKAVSYIIHLIIFAGILVLGMFIPSIYDRTLFWEITYGVIPVVFICLFRYCVIRIPVISKILEFFGKHSMTIFLTHTFIRYNYLNEFVYSRGHFLVIFLVLTALSVALAYVLDLIKGICRYDKLIDKLTRKITAENNKA